MNIYFEIQRDATASSAANRSKPLSPDASIRGLTSREDVLERMRWRLSNREIAPRLEINLNPVRSHTKDLFHKLGVKSRTPAFLLITCHPAERVAESSHPQWRAETLRSAVT
ncbi:hypothetical protein BJF92_13195 [Rhizobium rhizosphaerae]|uniref:HTH luxR-type domain-containing protein n=1 Tax=Xaviernesmea rhizosphaerae TaxID=1672749 RepID=A0A1Q9AHT3_9HYPH|nr:LuxR C-terminal-related transcriptional regulator [Xaviernesmea rhizosphaerae]OLP54766.1 hypothetical protein BJF92_13195 [Xaviernesmea rhizosphaerae]